MSHVHSCMLCLHRKMWAQPFTLFCRSISAAYEMVKLDYKNVKILKGGLSDWIRQERPLEE